MQAHDASTHPLLPLAELCAADQAKAMKHVFDRVDAGELTEEDANRLCADVEEFAVQRGIDLTRGLSWHWLVEFRDPDGGQVAAIVPGYDIADAEDEAIGLGGPIVVARVRQIPRRRVPDEKWLDRLLTAQELRELGDLTAAYYDA